MKKATETIGIDVSKLTLNVFVRTTNVQKQFSNDSKGFKQFVHKPLLYKLKKILSVFFFHFY